MSNCPTCGSAAEDGDGFCRACGASLGSAPPASGADRKPDMHWWWVVLPGIVVVVLAATVVLVPRHSRSLAAKKAPSAWNTPAPLSSPLGLPAMGTWVTVTDAQHPDITLLVTVDNTRSLPGDIFGVHMQVQNKGSASYDDGIYGLNGSAPVVVLYDTKAKPYNLYGNDLVTTDANGYALPDLLQDVHVWSGGEAAGWVYFRVDSGATPSSLRFQPTNWSGLAEWQVG